MEAPDYTNWQQERDLLIDDVLRILREQQDLSQDFTDNGTVSFNPQIFSDPALNHLVLGPINFGTTYNSPPQLLFNQKPNISLRNFVVGKATFYTPFLVIPYIYDFTWKAGSVDGFYIGLYAPNNPADSSLSNTSIFWFAAGSATRYREEKIQESWTNPIDYNEPAYLVDNG